MKHLIYRFVFAGFFAFLLCLRCISLLEKSFRFISIFISKHTTCRLVLRRHQFEDRRLLWTS